jgi:outer membrane protein insertion porin family
MKKGEWYKHSYLFKDIDMIKRKYGDEGYPFVTVVPERKINSKNKTVSFIYHIQKGNKCNVGRIEIVGNKSSKDKVIRRELKLFEGELYTYSGQKISEIRLKRTGFYDEVKITLKQGKNKKLVNVLVTVKERKSGTFNVGAGYSSFDGIQFNAKIQQSNFLGYGQTISFQGQASKIRKELSFSIYEPYFMDYNISLNTSAYFRHYAYDSSYYGYYADYSQDSYGFGLIWGIPLGDYFNVYFGYKLDQVSIGGAAKKQMAFLFRDMFTSALQFMFAFDSRNDRMFPTHGIYTMISTEIDPIFMGSNENFLKLSYNFRFYHPIFWKFVYRVNFDLGWNRQLDNKELPYSERFKLGGVFSLRGYPYSSIGGEPIGVSDNGSSPVSRLHPYIIGGDKKIVINNEIEVPLIEKMRLKFVTFLDIGNAYSENENFFYLNGKGTNKYNLPLGMFWSAGFGIRWVTGIAPLSFEWGFPLTPRPDDPKFMFEFNFKNSF